MQDKGEHGLKAVAVTNTGAPAQMIDIETPAPAAGGDRVELAENVRAAISSHSWQSPHQTEDPWPFVTPCASSAAVPCARPARSASTINPRGTHERDPS